MRTSIGGVIFSSRNSKQAIARAIEVYDSGEPDVVILADGEEAVIFHGVARQTE